MPAENPFTHSSGGGTGYVTSEAEAYGSPAQDAAAVPVHLAVILIASAVGLWALKKAGFRFVVSAGTKGA